MQPPVPDQPHTAGKYIKVLLFDQFIQVSLCGPADQGHGLGIGNEAIVIRIQHQMDVQELGFDGQPHEMGTADDGSCQHTSLCHNQTPLIDGVYPKTGIKNPGAQAPGFWWNYFKP